MMNGGETLLEAMQNFFEAMGPLGLFLYAILETISLIPPTEVIQMPLSVTYATNEWMLLWLAVISVIGTNIGIIIVWFLMRLIKAERLIKFIFRNEEGIAKAKQLFVVHGSKAIFISGITPIPYSLILYVALAAGLSLKSALISSNLSRNMRFFFVAAVLLVFKNVANEEFVRDVISVFTLIATVITIVATLTFLYAGKTKKAKQAKIIEQYDDMIDYQDFDQPSV